MDSGTFRVLLRLVGCAKQLKKKDGGPNSVDDRICTEKLFSLGGTVARAKKPFTGYNARGDTGSILACCRFPILSTPLLRLTSCPKYFTVLSKYRLKST